MIAMAAKHLRFSPALWHLVSCTWRLTAAPFHQFVKDLEICACLAIVGCLV
jgi:hypothetical protein